MANTNELNLPPRMSSVGGNIPKGLAVATVYQTGESCQLSPVAPVADLRTKRVFMCAYHRTSWFELWVAAHRFLHAVCHS
jgi:hypothetical protein